MTMTGGPLKQGRSGIGVSFPITGITDGLTVTRGIVVVKKPSGASQEWACSVSSATATAVTLLHVVDDGDTDEAGYYGWTAHLYDGPSNADDRIHESVDVPRGLHIEVPLSTVPS